MSSAAKTATTSSSSVRGIDKKRDPLSPSSSSRHHRGRRSRRGQVEGGDLSNLATSNLPDDWGREKEVTEEKQVSSGKQSKPS